MSERSGEQTLLQFSSSAAVSLAKMCPAQARARALLESARACGVSSLVWSQSFNPNGSLSRTSRAVRDGGSMRSCVSWKSSAMRSYLSRLRRVMSELLTSEGGCSLLPTLTVHGNYNRKGASPNSGDGLWTALRTLPARDAKGPAPKHTKGGRDLASDIGGHLNPEWCLYFMGFPAGWLEVDDAHVFARSGTRSSRNAPKSSGG